MHVPTGDYRLDEKRDALLQEVDVRLLSQKVRGLVCGIVLVPFGSAESPCVLPAFCLHALVGGSER